MDSLQERRTSLSLSTRKDYQWACVQGQLLWKSGSLSLTNPDMALYGLGNHDSYRSDLLNPP